MAWRIEKAKTDRSACRYCHERIEKDEHRFGNDELNAYWYHLACAPKGKPRAFAPFAEQAAKLAPASPKAPAKPKTLAGSTRAIDPALVARFVADPDNAETRAVFADALQAIGDPWGELIALEAAGKSSAAKRVFKQHADSLTGGFGARTLVWSAGLVEEIHVDQGIKPARLCELLPRMLGLRTAVLARELYVPALADAAVVRIVSEQAPRKLRKLFMWLADPIAELAVPSLEELVLLSRPNHPLDVRALGPLLDAKHLPALREVQIFGHPLPLHFVDALAGSGLLRQLDRLKLTGGALDERGHALLERRGVLDNLKVQPF